MYYIQLLPQADEFCNNLKSKLHLDGFMKFITSLSSHVW